MKRRLLLLAASLSAGLIISGATRAEDWKPVGQVGFFSVGKAYEMETGHFYWVGEYAGTFFSDKGEKGLFDHAGVRCPAWADNNLNNKTYKGAGSCSITDHDGDTAYATFQNVGDTVRGPGTFEWTGGTVNTKRSKEVTLLLVTPG